MVMNAFWLKMAVLVVIVPGLIILVNEFSASKDEPETEPRNFYQVIEEDDRRLRAEPEVDQPKLNQTVETVKPQPKEMTPEDRLQAEKLFEMALAQRKMARLPGVSYKLMVDCCRQIIKKYPESSYAAKARRMLREMPQRYRKQYNVTDEEIGLSK